MTAAEATCAPGGVIIMVSACSDGHGGQSFYDTFAQEPDEEKIMASFLATPSDRTIPDQWEAQILCRILLKHPGDHGHPGPPGDGGGHAHALGPPIFRRPSTWPTGLLGRADSPITVIPDGVSVIVKK